MDFSQPRVQPVQGTGDRRRPHKKRTHAVMDINAIDDEDAATILKKLSRILFSEEGTVKIGGSVEVSFVPKANNIGYDRLISADMDYYFHQMQEGYVYANDDRHTSLVRSYNTPSHG